MYSSQPGQRHVMITEAHGYPAVAVLPPCCVIMVFECRLLVEICAGGCSGGATSCSFSLHQAIRGAAWQHSARSQTGTTQQPAAARHLWAGGRLQAARTSAAAVLLGGPAALLAAAVVAVSAPAAAPVVAVRPAAAAVAVAQAPRLACRGPCHLHQAGASAEECLWFCAANVVACSCADASLLVSDWPSVSFGHGEGRGANTAVGNVCCVGCAFCRSRTLDSKYSRLWCLCLLIGRSHGICHSKATPHQHPVLVLFVFCIGPSGCCLQQIDVTCDMCKLLQSHCNPLCHWDVWGPSLGKLPGLCMLQLLQSGGVHQEICL